MTVEEDMWGQRNFVICFFNKINSAYLYTVGNDPREQGNGAKREDKRWSDVLGG